MRMPRIANSRRRYQIHPGTGEAEGRVETPRGLILRLRLLALTALVKSSPGRFHRQGADAMCFWLRRASGITV